MPAAESREDLVEDYDSAVDRALGQMGDPPKDEESPAPPKPALRRVSEEVTDGAQEEPEVDDSDPVAVQARQRADSEAQQREALQKQVHERNAAYVAKYADFLRDIETNPELRDHVLKFWNGGSGDAERQQAAPQEDDPLAGYDERDRTALNKYIERREQAMLKHIRDIVAPFQEQLVHSAAERELTDLAKDYPDWEKWVTRKDLAEVRQQFPQLSLKAAYRIASYDRVRGKVSNADRQLATVRDVLSRKAPAESQPRRHVKVDKREMNFDEGFDRAYAQAKAAGWSPGR